jgi:hypothetical protein
MDEDFKLPKCPLCKESFANVFEAVEHMMEDGEDFDPVLLLPNGYRLMVGSLLRFLYEHSHNKKVVQEVVQSTYLTLFTAETKPHLIQDYVEDVIVRTTMMDIDNDLKKLLETGE